MKRRKFNLLAGSGVAAAASGAAVLNPALAQSKPDPSLLTTTLTPLGALRAGNADGSIPAWTGGNVSASVGPDTPIDQPFMPNEKPLYIVDASNLSQYDSLTTPGTKLLIQKNGLSLQVYPTYRTAAAPQYIYDNTAKNAVRAQLLPQGGRFGFTGGYGGPAFPILSSDPYDAGAQIIWNHLVRWQTYQNYTKYAGGYVVTGGNVVVTFGGSTHYDCSFYDPNGSLETYDGYLSRLHEFYLAPAAEAGQEIIVWVSSNVLAKPDITWTVVTGQGRVRKAPDEAYDTPNPTADGINNFDDASCFAGSPQKYDWKLLGKQEMLVPYNCNAFHFVTAKELVQPNCLNPDYVRWEKHRVWVVDARLHPGERNTTARRMIYVDEDTWTILLIDNYDADGNMMKTGACYNRTAGSLPCTWEVAEATYQIGTTNYTVIGSMVNPPYSNNEYLKPQDPGIFNPQQMAASASF